MKYLGSNYQPCAWVFVSNNGSEFNLCDAATALAQFGNNLNANNHNLIYEIFVGPNDCTALFTPPMAQETIADAASKLSNLVSYASVHTPGNVHFYAVVDAEGYVLDANGYCGAQDPLHIFAAVTLFQQYRSHGAVIGPAGGPRYAAGDQDALSQNGGGLAVPQAYTAYDVQTAWPTTITNGYAAIQLHPLDPMCDCLTSDTGEWIWYQNHHSQHPPIDFNWDCPGDRC